MADRNSVLKRVKKVTAEVLNADAGAITESTAFAGDLGAESIDSIKLVAAFDEEFDIEMKESEAVEVQTVGKAADFILKYLD